LRESVLSRFDKAFLTAVSIVFILRVGAYEITVQGILGGYRTEANPYAIFGTYGFLVSFLFFLIFLVIPTLTASHEETRIMLYVFVISSATLADFAWDALLFLGLSFEETLFFLMVIVSGAPVFTAIWLFGRLRSERH
jgi:hypothetical protein